MQAKKSIEAYGIQAVIANILETRKEELWIVHGPEQNVMKIRRNSENVIEKQLVEAVCDFHSQYIYKTSAD